MKSLSPQKFRALNDVARHATKPMSRCDRIKSQKNLT